MMKKTLHTAENVCAHLPLPYRSGSGSGRLAGFDIFLCMTWR